MTRTAARVVPASIAWLPALREPQIAASHWSLAEWEAVVRTARRLRLLARLAAAVEGAGMLDALPEPARRSLVGARRLSAHRTAAVEWAIDRVAATLAGLDAPRVLLKGAAYLGQGLPIARGRLPSDLDILVPQAALAEARRRLHAAGWAEAELDAHERRYYLDWSHELPPMRHPLHPVELDVHHNIRPPVARLRVDADRLLARLASSRRPGWQVLDPADQVLHAAAHLILDAELRDRVRDLVDLDGLLRHFGGEASFWQKLVDAASESRLGEPLALALHFCVEWLATPVPESARAAIERIGPGAARGAWLRRGYAVLLAPPAPDVDPGWRRTAWSGAMLVRHHLERMPPKLLAVHVWHRLRVATARR